MGGGKNGRDWRSAEGGGQAVQRSAHLREGQRGVHLCKFIVKLNFVTVSLKLKESESSFIASSKGFVENAGEVNSQPTCKAADVDIEELQEP